MSCAATSDRGGNIACCRPRRCVTRSRCERARHRRAILARLARGDASVGDLAKPFDISLPAVSRHLDVLERARLIERRVDAQWRVCRLRARPLRKAANWIDHYRRFWEAQLDSLAELLEASPPERRKQ